MFFHFQRVLFIIHFYNDLPENSFREIVQIFYFWFRLDLASLAYIIVMPFLLILVSIILKNGAIKKWVIQTALIFSVLFMIFSALIFSGELVSYIEWRTKLSSKIYVHLSKPDEVLRTSGWVYSIWFLLYFVVQIIAFIIGLRFILKKNLKDLIEIQLSFKAKIANFLGFFIVGFFIIIYMIRGGLQQIPISATASYFSNHQIINDISVNSFWNFLNMTSIYLKNDLESYYGTFSKEEADQIRKEFYSYEPSDSIPKILKTNTPNLIFVTLESWSAQMIEALGGEPNITPYFNQLCKEGVLFTQAYATSATSETGHTSIFSGYPSIPGFSISSESAKSRKLPSITEKLKVFNYESSYYFGGDLTYGNIGGYLKEIGFNRITDEKDLDLHPKGKLGFHDEAMFPYFYNEIENAKRPFIYGLFTQSTHAPYDMPFEAVKGYPEESEAYITSLKYADLQIERFVKKLEKLPDFDNTLVVFVSDHSRTHYKNYNISLPEFYHIPILFWGGAIKKEYRGLEIDKIVSQIDISKTLLHQMGLDSQDFIWSKNMLDENAPSFALFSHTYTYSLKLNEGFITYHVIDKSIVLSNFETKEAEENALIICKALVESIYYQYKEM